MPGAGADPIWSEPESAPGPRTSGAGAAKKSSGSATLVTFSVVDPNTLNLDPDPEFFYPICFWIRIQSYASNV